MPELRARVILDVPLGLLDYRIPQELTAAVRPGVAVRIPLGKRRTRGYVARVEQGPGPEGIVLRDIEGLDPELPTLPVCVVELILFTADYYAASYGDVLATALPATARTASMRFRLTQEGQRALDSGLSETDLQVLQLASRFARGFTVAAVEREVRITRSAGAARLRRLTEKGWLEKLSGHRNRGPRVTAAYRRCEDADASVLNSRQNAVRRLLDDIPHDRAVPSAELAKCHADVHRKLKTLLSAGLVERTETPQRKSPALPDDASLAPEPMPTPTPDQAAAIKAINEAIDLQSYATFLLQGVTGSGKTEVYLRVIERALSRGRTALVLVPEIALTPQLGARFRNRFGDRVAIFHSGLTVAERRDEWERVLRGGATIGLGARSALFLPLSNLGVIIVDEEHETSFKQEESPRYHARDLAVLRGHREGAVVLLGSATPSLESRANADGNRYQRLNLPNRVGGRPLPEVILCDLTEQPRVGDGIFTETMAEAVERTLRAGDQAILFLNRRGFAPYVYCRDCGHCCRCPDCDVSLTLHRRRELLLCHYCGFEQHAPDRCESCAGHRMEAFGLGTERLEAEIQQLFGGLLGQIPVARLDRDTVRRRGDINRILTRFRQGKARLLVGTQMVTKGHDFPGVTMVGVVSADASLNFPDFRAAERTFQLLTQVAGRAGRGNKPGHVFVQSFETSHYAVAAALRHDYELFVSHELAARRELQYPPFSHLAMLRFEGATERDTFRCATEVADSVRGAAAEQQLGVSILGPAPAPLSRLKGLWRVHVLCKAAERSALRRAVRIASSGRQWQGVRQILDVDPLSML